MIKELKPFFVSLVIILGLFLGMTAHAQTSFFPVDLLPTTDAARNLGTTTGAFGQKSWLRVVAKSFYDTDASDGCATFSSNVLTSTGVACGSGSGGSFSFTPTSYGVSTSTVVGFTNGLIGMASSTFTGNLTFGGVTGSAWSTFCTAITGGAGLCDGTDDTSAGGGTFPFTPTTNFGAIANSTSTPIWFTQGLQASSTSYFTKIVNKDWTLATSTTVCVTGNDCQYSSIQTALTAGWKYINVKDGVYSEQLTFPATKVTINFESENAILQCNGATQSPCISTGAKDEWKIFGGTIRETNAASKGIAIDYSGSAKGLMFNTRINNFATSTYAHDTTNNTFYNKFENIDMFEPISCADIGGTQANENIYMNIQKCRPLAVDGGIAFMVVDARGLSFSNVGVEGTTTVRSNIGWYFDATSRDNKVDSTWTEAIGTGISIVSGANNIFFNGGNITSNGTDISDSGTNSRFLGVNKTGTKLFNTGSATSTNFAITTLTSCDSLDTNSTGDIICGTDAGTFPFTPDSYGGQTVNATSTGLWLKGSALSLIASSTFATRATATNATSTNFYYSNELRGLKTLGTATYGTLQHLMNFFNSPGLTSGGALTGGSSLTTGAGTGLIKASDSNVADLNFHDFVASSTINFPTATSTLYLGVEYNAGSPRVVNKTSDTWDLDTEYPTGIAIRETGSVYVNNNPWITGDTIANIIERFDSIANCTRDNRLGGLIVSNSGTRNVAVTTGAILCRLSENNVSAIDTSSSGSFDAYYQNGSGGWTKQYAATQWNNSQYDDGSGTLASITVTLYSSRWWYLMTDGTLAMVYGQAQNTALATILNEAPPSTVPDRIGKGGLLIGRFIIQASATTPAVTQSAFGTTFTAASVTAHSSLSGLSADDHTQYVLLTGRAGDTITRSTTTQATTTNHFSDSFTGNSLTIGGSASTTITGAGVITFNNDITLTQSTDLLTLAGGTLRTLDINPTTGSAIRTSTGAASTFLLQARDTGASAYTTFDTFIAGNPATRLSTTTSATTTNLAATTASTTNLIVSSAGGSAGCATFSATGLISNTGSACGTGGGGSNTDKWATSTGSFTNAIYPNANANTMVGIGTSTPYFGLTVSSTTGPQFGLSSGSGFGQWTMRNAGGNLYFATTSATTYATSSKSALTVNSNGYLGIATTSPMNALSVIGNEDHWGNYYHFGTSTVKDSFYCSSSSQCLVNQGFDSTQVGVSIEVGNSSPATNAYSNFVVTNDIADPLGYHYSAYGMNSSNYNDTTFGTGIAAPNQVFLINSDGLISIVSATSTDALHQGGIDFLTGGANTGNRRMFINTVGLIGMGTSTQALGTLTISSTTAPQLNLSASGGFAQWAFRNAGGNLYFSTTTVAGTATTTTAAASLLSSGVPSLTIGSSTPQITLKNGTLVLGGGGDSAGKTGSSTISMGKIQIDGMNDTGGRVCMYVVGTSLTVSSGACNP